MGSDAGHKRDVYWQKKADAETRPPEAAPGDHHIVSSSFTRDRSLRPVHLELSQTRELQAYVPQKARIIG